MGIEHGGRGWVVADGPASAEGGRRGFDLALWIVLYGPAGTPQPILKQLQSEVAVILKDADVRTRFAGLGAEPVEMPYDAFVARMKSGRATLGDVIKRGGVRTERPAEQLAAVRHLAGP